MAAATMVSFRRAVLPWSISPEDERRFRRIALRVLVVVALFSLVFSCSPRYQEDRTKAQELPPQYAKLLLERPATPPPPPPKIERPADEAPKTPEVAKPDVAKPTPVKPPPIEARRPEPNKPPGEVVETARRKAAGVGLLAMKDDLADLRAAAPAAVQLKTDIKQGPGVGSGTGVGVGAGNDAGIPDRAMITSNATRGSGGINTGAYSRDTGGGGLAGRSTTLVEGVPGGGGGGGPGGSSLSGAGRPGGTLQRAGTGKASRSIEEIKLVFERNKGAIYAIYNRALREDPSLQGKVVLELKIAPTGDVVDCRIVSSDLKSADLERKLLARIRQFDFGAKNVEQMVVSWPLDFLPA